MTRAVAPTIEDDSHRPRKRDRTDQRRRIAPTAKRASHRPAKVTSHRPADYSPSFPAASRRAVRARTPSRIARASRRREPPVFGGGAAERGLRPRRAHQAGRGVRGGAEQEMSDFVRHCAGEQRLHVDTAPAGERGHAIHVNRGQRPGAKAGVDERIAKRHEILLREMRRQAHETDRELIGGQWPRQGCSSRWTNATSQFTQVTPTPASSRIAAAAARAGDEIAQRGGRVVCPDDNAKLGIDDGRCRRVSITRSREAHTGTDRGSLAPTSKRRTDEEAGRTDAAVRDRGRRTDRRRRRCTDGDAAMPPLCAARAGASMHAR